MIHPFNESFLLGNDTGRTLYAHASRIPIFDYHNHLRAKDILEDVPFADLASLFLGDDHYKWRLTRANGAPERLVSGDASGYEKFLAYAKALPLAAGSPLPVWNRLELKRYFGIDAPLSGDTAKDIWDEAKDLMRGGSYTPRMLLARSNVASLITTDDPADELMFHAKLAEDSSFPVKVLPGFRPERAGEMWRGADWGSTSKRSRQRRTSKSGIILPCSTRSVSAWMPSRRWAVSAGITAWSACHSPVRRRHKLA